MPKKSTGYTPSGRNKSNPVEKEAVPLKNPATPKNTLPEQITGGPNKVATMPGTRFPKLTRPAPLKPRTPRI